MITIKFNVVIKFDGSRHDFNNKCRAAEVSRNKFIQIFNKNMTDAIQGASLDRSRVTVKNIDIDFNDEDYGKRGIYT